MTRLITIERIPDPFASLYDKATRMVIKGYYAQLAKEVVSSLKAGSLLDLGTGPGYLPIEIVQRTPSIEVTGIDLSRKLIHMAQLNASKSSVADRLNFEIADAAKLRFDNESFDMVISTGMLHMLKDPVTVLKECYRVLKSGGEAWIFDPARVSSQIDRRKWKISLSLRERFLYVLFILFRIVNPPHRYKRKQVIEMINATEFNEYSIKEEDEEIIIKLKR